MTTAPHAGVTEKTPRRRLPLVGVVLVVVLIWLIVCAVFVVGVARRLGFLGGTGPAVTISRETTYIVQPLRDDGYVDYLAALNQRSRDGVTPENNAALLIWQALGPAEIVGCYGEEDCDWLFRELGVPRPPDDGEYFVSLRVYASQMQGDPPADQQREPSMDEWGDPARVSPTWES